MANCLLVNFWLLLLLEEDVGFAQCPYTVDEPSWWSKLISYDKLDPKKNIMNTKEIIFFFLVVILLYAWDNFS